MDNKKLYILTYDHGGYVLWKDRVKPRIKEIFEWMEKYPKLRIGLDYESFTFDEFSRCDPEVVSMIGELLKKYPDRVGLGATTYGQPLSLTISEESNARQLTYAIRTNKKYFGITPNVYCISEFALNNQTPQLLRLTGHDAAILRSHVMGYGYPRTFDSAWGRWIGKDKTEIPAVPTYDKMGRGFNCCTVDNWILSRWPQDTKISLEDFEEMFSKYSPLLASRYDDLTQPIEEVTAYIETKDNYEYVLLEDIPSLYGEAVDELPTTDNDFHVQMPWGYCGNEIFNGVRKAEVEAVQAEKLNAFSALLGGKAYNDDLDDAWKYALAAQHHDVTICGLLDLSRRFIPSSLEYSAKVKQQSLKALAANFKGGKDSVLAVNAHSFDVDEWVDGIHVNLPAFTAKRIVKSEETYGGFEWNAENGELKTPYYKLVLNEKGIAYIERLNGERIFDNGSGELFSALVDEKPCGSQGVWNVEITSCGACAVQKGMIGTIAFTFEMRFNGDSPRIDCKCSFELHGERVGVIGEKAGLNKSLTVDGHRHDGKICMNMNLCLDKSRKMFRDLPYSISEWDGQVRVTEDYWYKEDLILIDEKVSPEESFDSATQLNGIYWLCMRDEKQGLAVLNRGCMGSQVEGNRLSVPLLYSNIYLCGDRIIEGVFDDEFALLPFQADTTEAQIQKTAMSYAYQPSLIPLDESCGALEELKAFGFESSNEAVILTTVYPEDGALLARFCNYSDDSAQVSFDCSNGAVKAESDLLGNVTAEIDGNAFAMRPWEIKTVKIELR